MTQNEVVWALFSVIQMGIVSFIGYWTRRVQALERAIADSTKARTDAFYEFQGRVSRLEAQFGQIMGALARIEREVERTNGRIDDDEEE